MTLEPISKIPFRPKLHDSGCKQFAAPQNIKGYSSSRFAVFARNHAISSRKVLLRRVLVSKSSARTEKIASELARTLIKAGAGDSVQVIALEGELGAGKTVFVRGFARGLGVKNKISSPTFVLMKKYPLEVRSQKLEARKKKPEPRDPKKLTKLKDNEAKNYLCHIDCYRLRDEKDFRAFSLHDIIKNPENIVLIEWAERVRKVLPKKHIKVRIDHIGTNSRRISVNF